ncbi:MAG TPA: hypothetical protein VLA93_23070 [Pyrinomonadaceae bacterium]|nr:hypothetical protein [Pyrinomonadaceae bacterium]
MRYLETQSSSLQKTNTKARSNEEDHLEDDLEDDRLRLIFACCRPSLAPEARIALTLREVCGLTTEEIAKAFLIMYRRRGRIAEARYAYEKALALTQQEPERQFLQERIEQLK